MILYGERKKKRYVSKFSNDSKMFQFAPEYIQRIEDWKKEALKSKEKREIEVKHIGGKDQEKTYKKKI